LGDVHLDLVRLAIRKRQRETRNLPSRAPSQSRSPWG
jgi:hypothetical protein